MEPFSVFVVVVFVFSVELHLTFSTLLIFGKSCIKVAITPAFVIHSKVNVIGIGLVHKCIHQRSRLFSTHTLLAVNVLGCQKPGLLVNVAWCAQ